MPTWLQAGLWGLLGGGALVLGALVAWFVRVPQVVIASVMAFGSGVLISAVAFDLMTEAADTGGLVPTAVGFVGGALAYLGANVLLARRGAKHRKRSGSNPEENQPSEEESQGSGTAIAIGALLDGIPESAAIGVSLVEGGAVGAAVVAAVFISNVPEALSASAGMKTAGRSTGFILGLWAAVTVASALAAAAGFAFLASAPVLAVAVVLAFAAGAMLTMTADTMLPEAVDHAGPLVGVVAALGFTVAFLISS